ncbi:MAG: hypothetical protein KA792_08895 [Bacteroidales bacterium]|nr:hypothetical protein [Bacteroidales bacterium]
MKENNEIDKLFRDKLANYGEAPPPDSWKNISYKINKNNFKNYLFVLLSIIFILFITTFIGYYYFNKNSKNITSLNYTTKYPIPNSQYQLSDKKKTDLKSNNTTQHPIPNTKYPIPNTKYPVPSTQYQLSDKKKTDLKSNNITQYTIHNTQYPVPSTQYPVPSTQYPVQNTRYPLLDKDKLVESLNNSEILKIKSKNYNLIDSFQSTPLSLINFDETIKKKNKIKAFYFIGFNYTPEYVKNRLLKNNSLINNFDLNLRADYGSFYLSSGLGLSYSYNDYWNYSILYEKNEVIGKYNKVDSVAFSVSIDTVFTLTDTIYKTKIKPNFFTSETEVKDKIQHKYNSTLSNKIIYLFIPFKIGTDLYRTERLTAGINVGGTIVFLISEKKPDINLKDKPDNIIFVDNKAPGRVRTYYNYLLTLSIKYSLSDKILINFEPQYKASIGSVYSGLNKNKTETIGCGIGLIYKIK